MLQDAFLEWEESTEPGEQEGKGVALKSCTQFFQWLKTAELEDDEEEQKVKKKDPHFSKQLSFFRSLNLESGLLLGTATRIVGRRRI